MNICLNKSQCGKINPFHARYCVYCGIKLKGPPAWGMNAGNPQRSSHYPEPTANLLVEGRYPHEFIPEENDPHDMPQPVMAYNFFWCWGLPQKTLFRIPVQLWESQATEGQQLEVGFETSSPLSYANSLCFDGVFIDFICNDQFFRISMYDGSLAGPSLRDDAFRNIQKAAPLVVSLDNPDDPYRPYRYWITPLRDHVLLVDIRIKGKEKYLLIPWKNQEGRDAMRSPVLYGNTVYLLTKNGRLFRVPITGEYDAMAKKVPELHEMPVVKDQYCFAPMVIGDHLVFEILSKKPHNNVPTNGETWHMRGLGSVNLKTQRITTHSLDHFEKLKYLERFGHLSGLSDGCRLYLHKDGRDGHCIQWVPGRQPSKCKLDNAQVPVFDCENALFVGRYLHFFDTARSRLLIWNVCKSAHSRSIHIPGKGTKKYAQQLFAQPVMFGNILGLLLKEQIVFVDVGSRPNV